jgi:D-alanyl-D-alanine carboxypeptidase
LRRKALHPVDPLTARLRPSIRHRIIMRLLRVCTLALLVFAGVAATAGASEPDAEQAAADLRRLLAAYPERLAAIEGGMLVWKDGTRMPLDDGKGRKSLVDWLARPDIEDMLAVPYPAGETERALPGNDPGRARNLPFFLKMYGDCRKGEVDAALKEVAWLPGKSRQRLRVTTVNGVAERVDAISKELARLPARFDVFLKPSAGAYTCRRIAGEERLSAHGLGIAVDIAVAPAYYWRWSKQGAESAPDPSKSVPPQIVRIFEAHGFIWGGKWHHYDTMHFEYRPELLVPVRSLP